MTHSDLFNILKKIGIEVAYDHFDTPVNPPFIVYRESDPDSLFADDINYVDFLNFEIELVTKKKDLLLENSISNKLKENEIPYRKNQLWDSAEKIYHTIYEI